MGMCAVGARLLAVRRSGFESPQLTNLEKTGAILAPVFFCRGGNGDIGRRGDREGSRGDGARRRKGERR